MSYITPEALEFLEEAKKGFNDIERTTYRNEKEGFIALRNGFMEDGLEIFELGNKVGFFTEQLPQQRTKIIECDELERLRDLEREYRKVYKLLKYALKVDGSDTIKGILINCSRVAKQVEGGN